MVRVEDQQGDPAEIIADAPIVSAWVSKRIQIYDGKQKVAV